MKSVKDSSLVQDMGSFERMASWLHLSNNLHPGRYEVKEGMSNYQIISMLKKGASECCEVGIKQTED
ncbi:MAG: hypothetical protein IPK62_10700 [Bacteroidetes bacterium]|nr:hypothetical protein [Bacteroidota bacterium]